MFEVFAANEFRVTVFTPKGKVALVDTGIYRIDIMTDGTGLIAVTKGKAEVGDANVTKVKDGRTATIGDETVAIAKFDKDKRDALGEWSRWRAKELSRITSLLQQSANLNNSLLNGFNRGGWNLYDSFGLWIFDARFGGYCFLPFGPGWYSPYGYFLRSGVFVYNLPIIQNPINPVTPPKVRITRNPSDTSDRESEGKTSLKGPRNIYEPPPFTKIAKVGGYGGDGSGFQNNNNNGTDYSADKSNRISAPTYSPPISTPAPPPPSEPAKVRINN